MRQGTGLSRQYSIELSMQVNQHVKMTFDSQKSVNMDELIGRLFRNRKSISAKRGGVLLRKESKEIPDYDRELLMDDRTVYRMERRRKLNLVEDKEDAEYTKKLRQFKQSKVKEYHQWSLICEQELYYNIASQKMAIANQESWIIFIPLSFFSQIFSKFSKNLYSSVNKCLLVKNRLFGDAKLSLDLIAKLLGTFSIVEMKRGEQFRETKPGVKDGQYFYILCSGAVKVTEYPARKALKNLDVDQTDYKYPTTTNYLVNNSSTNKPFRPSNSHILLESFSVLNSTSLLPASECQPTTATLDLLYTVDSQSARLLKLPAWHIGRHVSRDADLQTRVCRP